MDLRQLTPDLAVSAQILPEDLPALAEAGFRVLINNRPDEEVGPDMDHAAMRAAAEAAGLEGWERFSGHSLRARLATAAGERGADLAQVMRQTRHRSAEVALGYLRPADLWRNNPTRGIWTAAGDDGMS